MITFITVNEQFWHTNNSEFHQRCLFTYCLLCRTRHQTQHLSLYDFVKDLSYLSEAHHYGCTLADETLAFAYLHSYHPNAHIMVNIATSALLDPQHLLSSRSTPSLFPLQKRTGIWEMAIKWTVWWNFLTWCKVKRSNVIMQKLTAAQKIFWSICWYRC